MTGQSSNNNEDYHDQRKIVFVLGAGASFEAGLPVGEGLKRDIVSLLNLNFDSARGLSLISGDQTIYESFVRYTNNNAKGTLQKFVDAALSIRKAMPQALSIDNFLDAHSENKYIETAGKLAISKAILDAEAQSSLYTDNQNSLLNFENIESTWFNKFFQTICENCKFSDLEKRLENITVVSFNYDRCLEHFIFNAVRNYYGVDSTTAYETTSKLEILHPYGSIGSLSKTGTSGVSFGEKINPVRLLEVSKKIKTFTEQIDENSKELKRIQYCLKNTEKVIFLGFAYHPMNMNLLFPRNSFKNPECFILGTALHIAPYDLTVVRDDIAERFGNLNVHLDPVSCYDLYSSRWRTLSIAK
jgi:hypothetical protein